MLNIICALKHEAKPIVDYYDLANDGSASEFTTYANKERNITLAISGPGRDPSARCVEFLITRNITSQNDAWLNIGIAGHKTLEPGTPVLADKITDCDGNNTWSIQIPFNTNLITKEIYTLENPANDYNDCVCDMEAAGFYRAAASTGNPEFIHCLKIISDNQENPSIRISGNLTRELIKKNLASIDLLVLKLQSFLIKHK